MEHLYPQDEVENADVKNRNSTSKFITSSKNHVTPDQRRRGNSSLYEGGSGSEDEEQNPNFDGAGGTGGPVNLVVAKP